MNKLVAGLMFSTLAFAASTFYLSYQLGVEREKNLKLAGAPAPLPRQATLELPSAPQPGAPVPASDVADTSATEPAKRRDPGQLAVTRDRLAQLHDPARRAEQSRQLVLLFREDWSSIAPHIGIAPGELDGVLADLAERTMQGMEQRFECELEPSCDAEALRKLPGMSQEDRVAAALGPVRYARFKEFQETFDERNLVAWMNQQLGTRLALTEANADRLVQMLAEQRRQFIRDAEARGEKVEAESGFLTIRSAAAPGASDEYARRRESATAYVRRSIELVAGLLNREQLAWFRDAADNRLYSYTERLRRAEIAESARASSGR